MLPTLDDAGLNRVYLAHLDISEVIIKITIIVFGRCFNVNFLDIVLLICDNRLKG